MVEDSMTSTEAPRTYELPSGDIAEFTSRVEKMNRRLVKAGSAETFTFTFERIEKEVTSLAGIKTIQEWFTITLLSAPKIAAGDYTFVARQTVEEAGVIVATAPGQELNGYRVEKDAAEDCEHCNVRRPRKQTYLLRNNTTGELIQVGSSCIVPFLGTTANNLFAFGFEPASGLGEGGYRGEVYYPVEHVIAAAWIWTDQGRNYVSTKDWDRTSTKDRVFTFFHPPVQWGNRPADLAAKAEFEAKASEVYALIEDEKALTALVKAVETSVYGATSATSDYGQNLRVLFNGTSVSAKSLGFLASAVQVHAKALQIAAERAAAPAKVQGFIGEVGEKVFGIELTINLVRYIEGQYGTTTLIGGLTPEGKTVKWFRSGQHDIEVGDKLNLKFATVKSHDNYQGQDATAITRGKEA